MASWLNQQIRKHNALLLALPAILWLTLFFLLPLGIVFVVSFMTRGTGGLGELPFTLTHYERVFDLYQPIIIRSVRIAFYTTIICLIVGYPMAFFIKTRKRAFTRQIALFLVILPFWTNFLVRTYAWRVLLGNEGTINGVLQSVGLIDESLPLLFNQFAVLVGLVYGFLPFMVLPIYAAVERFDFRYIEAARDLGANDWQTFWRVIFPLTLPGVGAGCVLVFIPSIGAYVTPDLLGGTDGRMIGNFITGQFMRTVNHPLGSALSMVLMSMVMVALLIYLFIINRSNRTTKPAEAA